jgi:hypothetical protein
VLIIQVVAAALLLLGSGLIFRALLEIEAPTRRPTRLRSRPRPAEPESDVDLPRAA